MAEKSVNIRRLALVKPGYIVIISAVIIILMITSAFYELSENKQEIYHLLDEYASSMINTVEKSSENTIISDIEIENLLAQHLLGVARGVARLDSISVLSDDILEKVAEENEVFRINVFSSNGERLYSNYLQDSVHLKAKGKHSPLENIAPILNGETDEVIIGLKEARVEEGTRYAVAVRRPLNRSGAIVVNLDAESFLEFKKRIGFGKMILDIGSGTGIEYIMLQTDSEVVAANRNVDVLTDFKNDSFVRNAYNGTESVTRIIKFGGRDVFEIAKPFIVEGKKQGIFRIGLTMNEVKSAENRMFRRAAVMSLIVIVISVIVLSVVVSNQNYRIISRQYQSIQTFTGTILENMTHAVIAVDAYGAVKIFNRAASEIFNIRASDAAGKDISILFSDKFGEILSLVKSRKIVTDAEAEVMFPEGDTRILRISTNAINGDEGTLETYTVVIKDVTDEKAMEKQMRQNEKLMAMGELASGVAHEIRNPLNAINMISQRLDKEFSSKIDSSDFSEMTRILGSESARVNSIIEQFLRFAKPPKLVLSDVNVRDFLGEINALAELLAASKRISFSTDVASDAVVKMDRSQMKQVFINLIQNAFDSTHAGGRILVRFEVVKGKNVFTVADNGEGIPEENLSRIFDIYFTTKPRGTGMGLSIVRQIVLQHNGSVDVDSAAEKGTKFKIILP